MKKQYVGKRTFVILEDNDPTGNMSKKGIAEKKTQKLNVFTIPKRSPDLNVLDYSVWNEVEKKLRAQERNMGDDKHETRSKFEQRVDRTASGLPASYIDAAIGDLRKRCGLLYKAKGGLFEEGGRRARRPL